MCRTSIPDDARLYSSCLEFLSEPGTVIAAIGNEMRGWRQGAENETSPLVIAHLAFRQEQDERPSVAVANGVELRVQPAFCSPDTARNIPFLSRLAEVR